MSAETPVEETLAWEAEKRPRAALAAIAGGIATIAGNVLFTAIASGGPTTDDGYIGLTDALGARLQGEAPDGTSLRVRITDYLGDNVIPLSLSTILTSLSALCLALLVLYLWRATAARSQMVGRLPYYSALAALVLVPLGHMVGQIAQWVGSANFEDASVRTAQTARDVNAEPAVLGGLLLDSLGTFALAVAVVIISLHAMRTGLLTRFFGVLGMIVGVLPIFGLVAGYQLDQPGIIRGFWMIGVGLLIAGRLKTPPAWLSGRAEPWPSNQQIREQRAAERGGGDSKPAATAPAAGERPAELRKKRKRRR